MKPRISNRRAVCGSAFALFVTFGLVSLSTLIAVAEKKTAESKTFMPLVWPEPPDPPRIAWKQNVFRPSDLGAKVSGVRSAVNWLAGDTKGNESFANPFGIALDESNNLCLTDSALKLVSYFDRAHKKWQSWDHIGSVRFNSPVAIAKSGDTIFVADSGLAKIVVFGLDGKLRRLISEKLQRPSGITICDKRLFVADSLRHEILIFDLDGRYVSSFGRRGSETGELNFPSHIYSATNGNLYVTDSMNSRVQVFDAKGGFCAQIGGAGDGPGYFNRPKGVAVDRLGHIYVLDGMFDNIQIFNGDGRLLLNLGHAGSQAGEFWLPNGIAIGQDNQIYVTDSYNKRIQIFEYVGEK